jgi:tetratricopeptide (TPR) repeat protein
VSPEYLETGELVPAVVERALRVSDSELELRLHRDLEKAESVFAAVLEEGDSDPVLTARAHAGLGLLAAHRGDNLAAVNHLTAAVESGYVAPEARPDVYETLGAAQSAIGLHAAAVQLFERCLDELWNMPARGKRENAVRVGSLEIRFAAYLANALSELGELERARGVLNAALRIEDAPPAARVLVLWTRARLSWMNAEGYAALEYMTRAIGLLDSGEDRLQLARAHLLCAQMCNLDGRAEEAQHHLAEAEELLRQGADATDLGVLRAEQAKLAALKRRGHDAMRLAKEAEALLGDDARHIGLKAHVLGLAHALNRDLDAAAPHFSLAIDELERRRQWREATEVARSWARTLRTAGRTEEALEVMDRAAVLGARQLNVESRARVREV